MTNPARIMSSCYKGVKVIYLLSHLIVIILWLLYKGVYLMQC